MVLKRDVEKADGLRFSGYGPPEWKSGAVVTQGATILRSDPLPPAERNKNLPRFVMDTICSEAKSRGQKAVKDLKSKFLLDIRSDLDPHLVAPWQAAMAMAQLDSRRASDLELIKSHVECVHKRRQEIMKDTRQHSPSKGKPAKKGFTGLPIEKRQDQLRLMSQEFAAGPKLSDILMTKSELARTRASYAYVHDRGQKSRLGWSRFPWDVAFRELCKIKVSSTFATNYALELTRLTICRLRA